MKKILLVMSLFSVITLYGNRIDFPEDGYLAPASDKLNAQVEQIAKEVEFTGGYQVAIPKKAGVAINPWNKWVSATINPQSHLPLIVINSHWFYSLPKSEQNFWLMRFFIRSQEGFTPFALKITPWIYFIVALLVLFIFYKLITITGIVFLHDKRWLRVIIAYLLMILCNMILLNRMYLKINNYFTRRFDYRINRLVIEKTKDKQAAIEALERIDTEIKQECESGNIILAPYRNYFQYWANELKN